MNLVGYMLYKRVILHQTFRSIVEEIAQFLSESFSAPTVLYYTKRIANLLGAVYDQLVKEVRRAECVHVDETGCPMNGENWWTWVFVTKTLALYRIAKSRGHKVVEDILKDFKGTLVSDFYPAYNPLPYAKQKCIVHLFRRLEKALKAKGDGDKKQTGGNAKAKAKDKELEAFISEVVGLFQGAIEEAKERQRGEAEQKKETPTNPRKEERASVIGGKKEGHEKGKWKLKRIEAERKLEELIGQDYRSKEVKTLVKLLKKHKESLFRFLEDPQVGWENNAAERALRPLVVQRKISGGFRADESAQAHAVLYSIAETMRMRGENFIEVLTGVG